MNLHRCIVLERLLVCCITISCFLVVVLIMDALKLVFEFSVVAARLCG